MAGLALDGEVGEQRLAASMPDFIAMWVPLTLGTLRKPAVSPISTPPGKDSLGTDWKPPSLSARAP